MKRRAEDGQISRAAYELRSESSQQAAPAGFAVASSRELESRRLVKASKGKGGGWAGRGETALARELYQTRVSALNAKFAAWAEGQLAAEPAVAVLEAARDYVNYAEQLEAQFLVAHTDVLSFGSGDCGQLAHSGDLEDERDTVVPRPRRVLSLREKKVVMLSCGGLHNAACTADGKCYTWGCNDEGSLGRGGDEYLPMEVAVATGDPVTCVAAGDSQTFAVTMSGGVFGWGCYKDKEGKQWFDAPPNAGLDPKRKQSTPLEVSRGSPLSSVVAVKCGAAFNAALLGDGSCLTWGVGEVGELGRPVRPMRGSDGDYDKPAIVSDHLSPGHLSGLEATTFKALGCGAYHLLAATSSALYATGLNNYGQLGDGSTTDAATPVPVPFFDDVALAQLDGGQHHSLALCADGTLYSWGRADYGQLGIGVDVGAKAGDFVTAPTRVPVPTTAVGSVCSGSNHCLALSRSGAVFAWGYGDMNALGLGTAVDKFEPEKVSFASSLGDKAEIVVTQVAGGGQHSAVVASVKQFAPGAGL